MTQEQSKYGVRVPDCYMSFSAGTYRVIHKGLPICNDKQTMAEAGAAALQTKLEVATIAWNGHLGGWVSTSTLGTTNELFVPTSLTNHSYQL
jgi:hypothetical protein